MNIVDIFDRLMELPILRVFNSFYKKHQEVLLYLFFGGMTFFVSIGTFAIFNIYMRMNVLIANIFSWVIAVMFAFLTNRIWVFNAPTQKLIEFIKQMISFFGGRLITLFIEELILLIFITCLHFPNMLIKVSAQVIVILLNYVISKFFIFNA